MRCEHVGDWTRWVPVVVYDDAVWEYHGQEFGGGIMNAADKIHCPFIDTCTFNSIELESNSAAELSHITQFTAA